MLDKINLKGADYTVDEKVLNWFAEGNVFLMVTTPEEWKLAIDVLHKKLPELSVAPSFLSHNGEFNTDRIFMGINAKSNKLCIGDHEFFDKHPIVGDTFSVVTVGSLVEEIFFPEQTKIEENTVSCRESLTLTTKRMHELEQLLFQERQKVKAYERKQHA